jgi:acyl-ACP thioesterase
LKIYIEEIIKRDVKMNTEQLQVLKEKFKPKFALVNSKGEIIETFIYYNTMDNHRRRLSLMYCEILKGAVIDKDRKIIHYLKSNNPKWLRDDNN